MNKLVPTYRALFLILIWLGLGESDVVIGQIVIDTHKVALVSLYNEANINTPEIEYAPSFMNDKLVFLYSDVDHQKERGTGEYFFDIGFALSGLDNALVRRASFGSSLNTRYHEGPVCYDPLTDNMYVTRSGNKGKGKLKIYKHEHPMIGGRNSALNISSKQHSIGHPAIFNNGDGMILISDKESDEGKMDLHYSFRSGDKWSEIESLDALNTSSQELFPFVYQDTFLFFSSNRPGGYGGLDIYCAKLTNLGWDSPILLPKPINSSNDDFSMIVKDNGKMGYLTSNRIGGVGKDDIYRFESDVSLFTDLTKIKKEILILDKLSLSPVKDAEISVVPIVLNGISEKSNFKIDINPDNPSDEIIMKYVPSGDGSDLLYQTGVGGTVSVPIRPNTQYLLKITHDDFETSTVIVQNSNEEIVVVVDPKPVVEKPRITVLENTVEVGSVLIFSHIYYISNGADVNPESTYELDALADAMLANEGLFVDLIVHTDARGNKIQNMELSKKRAASTLSYLMDKGIDENRIIALGHGEDHILNHCTEGVPCSEGEHLVNRRIEVQIRRL